MYFHDIQATEEKEEEEEKKEEKILLAVNLILQGKNNGTPPWDT